MMVKQEIVLFFFLLCTSTFAFRYNNAQVDFKVPCESTLFSELETYTFMTNIEALYKDASVHLLQVWGHEISLIICSHNSVTDNLNYIESSQDIFAGVIVETIKFNAPCHLYEYETEKNQQEVELVPVLERSFVPSAFLQ